MQKGGVFLFASVESRNLGMFGSYVLYLSGSLPPVSAPSQGTLDVGLIDSVCASDSPDR